MFSCAGRIKQTENTLRALCIWLVRLADLTNVNGKVKVFTIFPRHWWPDLQKKMTLIHKQLQYGQNNFRLLTNPFRELQCRASQTQQMENHLTQHNINMFYQKLLSGCGEMMELIYRLHILAHSPFWCFSKKIKLQTP